MVGDHATEQPEDAASDRIILLVDDNPTNLGVLFDSLNHSGFRLLVAQDGESALEQVGYARPDIILLDVMMPGLDGFATCRQLKANPDTKDIPVIFMTALADTVDKVKGFEAGAIDYVTKPIQPDEVLARVKTHLAMQSLQRQLQDQNDRLQAEIQERQKVEAALRIFLHAVSHDLRNPVMGMSMVLKNLLKQVVSELKSTGQAATKLTAEAVALPRPVLDRMILSCDRQLKLINSLIEAHATEVWGVPLQCQPLSLGVFTQHLAADWQPMLEQHQAMLKNDIPPDLPWVWADGDQLWRVYENLIANALKHNPPGLTLTLAAEMLAIADSSDEMMIRCIVQDDGVGMTPEQSLSLFDLYAKGHSPRRDTGLGLGLFLCREIIQAHGGEIGIDSAPHAGSTFWFTLAIAPTSHQLPSTN